MADRLFCLWHHTIIGSDHNDGDIGHSRAACSHRRKGLMSRGVKEEDRTVATLNLAGTKVLGNAATLAVGNAGLAQRIEQARLAVVNVAHHGNDRCARDECRAWIFTKEFRLRCSWCGLRSCLRRGLIFVRFGLLNRKAELGRNEGGRFTINALVHGGKDAAPNQRVDDVSGVYLEQRCKIANDDGGGQLKDAIMHLRNTCWLRLWRQAIGARWTDALALLRHLLPPFASLALSLNQNLFDLGGCDATPQSSS